MTRDIKTALVTGGARRIGESLVRLLIDDGYRVILHYNKSERDARRIADEHGEKVVLVKADYLEPNAPQILQETVRKSTASLNLLVLSASYFPRVNDLFSSTGGIQGENREEWQRCMAINAEAPFFILQSLAPALKTGRGRVIFLFDSAHGSPLPSRTCYSASRAAAWSTFSAAAREFAPDVRSYAMELGYILPPEQMASEEADKVSWAGIDVVGQCFKEILTADAESGTVWRVGANDT
jgi:pteridine reductase